MAKNSIQMNGILTETRNAVNVLIEKTLIYIKLILGVWNNELQCYTQRHENLRTENGNLVINVRVEDWKDHGGSMHYTSGMVRSKNAWTYGRFEARAKLPKGKHLWPAIWLMPKDSKYGEWAASGEIDIMEYRGQLTNEIESTIHFGGTPPNTAQSGTGRKHFDFDFSADYHRFGMDWDSDAIKFYVDDQYFHNETLHRNFYSGKGTNPYSKEGQPFDQSFYWILNVAVGGGFFTCCLKDSNLTIDEAKQWPKPTMEIDYLRVYQWK
jgi:beta-glucanase (GH16 family)